MPLIRRSIAIAGHRTSVALEPEYWAFLVAQAQLQECSLAALIGEIDSARPEEDNLASALRVWALRRALDPEPSNPQFGP